MKLIIEIPEEVYKKQRYSQYFGAWSVVLQKCFENGTPLPKGHGRLIDADAFRLYCFRKNWDRRLSAGGLATINMYLDNNAPTIIEADKAESEKTETWNGIHAQITAPKGTFERIWNEAERGEE